MAIIKRQEDNNLLINKIIPVETKDRICIHCDKKDDEEDPVTYLIAEKGQGKTTETIRQAVFRRNTILSNEYDFYRSAGIKHADEAEEGEVSYMGLRDVFNNDFKLSGKSLELCVDNGKFILEELLSERFGMPVTIHFMSLEA